MVSFLKDSEESKQVCDDKLKFEELNKIESIDKSVWSINSVIDFNGLVSLIYLVMHSWIL